MFPFLASRRSASVFLLASAALLVGCAKSTTTIDDGEPSGGTPASDGGAVGTGGSAAGVGGSVEGGAPSGGAPSGGAASGGTGTGGAESGGAPSGGTGTGGAASGGAGVGGSGTGGSDAGGAISQTGGSETGGAEVGGNGVGGLEGVGGDGVGGDGFGGSLGDGGTVNLGGATDGAGGVPDGVGGDTGAGVGGAAALTCDSGVMDGDETDVDCGGSCAPGSRCKVGGGCTVGADCLSSTCIALVCETPTLSVKYGGCVNGGTCPTIGNSLSVSLEIYNNATTAADMKGVEVRYYFTDETEGADTVEIDHDELKTSSGLGVSTTVEAATVPAVGVDHYISLVYPAGTIAPSTGATISFRIHTVDYQGTLDPSNDYSFNASPAPVSSGTITLYRDGELIWGTEP